jgi:putative ABC transport system substrate-binding protein
MLYSLKRRNVITLLGGALAASALFQPFAARAQQTERVRRIGFLTGAAEDDPIVLARIATLRQGLQQLGWIEGRNVQFDYR